MSKSKFTNCNGCNGISISDLLEKIDCRLTELSYDMYSNIVFMLNKSVPNYELTQLLTYREILVNKQEDEDYVEDFSIDDIAGKIVKLTAGCELRWLQALPLLLHK